MLITVPAALPSEIHRPGLNSGINYTNILAMNTHIEPFKYRAECNAFPEWILILTLCLAPLIAHIISGTPSISYVTHSRPRWLDLVCHYNPTSILWQYAAIVDRRVRTTKWSSKDLAATNAIFWTASGWNGDESMVELAAPWCIKVPESSHVELLSITMLKTFIVTLQGASALYALVKFLRGTGDMPMGLDTIFFPLATFGLLRLFAAAWLTEDYAYTELRHPSKELSQRNRKFNKNGMMLVSIHDGTELWPNTPLEVEAGFQPPNASGASCVFRILYLIVCIGIWAMSLLSLIPMPRTGSFFSFTSFAVTVFYFVFLSVSVILYATYFLRGKTTTTIIPCFSSIWYKLYTILLIVSMLILIVIAALETKQRPDGVHSSFSYGDELGCTSKSRWWPVSSKHSFSGLVQRVPNNMNISNLNATLRFGNDTFSSQRFWLWEFTGYCMGEFGDS
jgi:hypothetical protein